MQTLHVVEVDPSTETTWEAFVSAHPDALVYHHPAWLRVLEEAYRHTPVALLARREDGAVSGVLPLFVTRGVFSGRRLSSLPHTPVAGPLATDEEAVAALLSAAARRADEIGARLQIKSSSPFLADSMAALMRTEWDETFVLELPRREEKLRFGDARNHSRIRTSVNKSTRLGLRVRVADTEIDLRRWYELYLETMRWHVVPPRPFRLFASMWDVLRPRGLMRLVVAEEQASGGPRLVAGSIFLPYACTVLYAFNGRRADALHLRPNDLIQWTAIEHAWKNGFRRFDLGEVSEDNPGLADFKRKWGSKPERLYRYYYPHPRRIESGGMARGTTARRLTAAGWRRMPLLLTERVGAALYRYF